MQFMTKKIVFLLKNSMRFLHISLIIVLYVPMALCQKEILIAENTFKIGAVSDQEFYYGFKEGDKIVLDLEVKDDKELKEVQIYEYPNTLIFSQSKIKKTSNKVINIRNTGVYKFRFYNSMLLASRTCQLKVVRIPKNPDAPFNSTVSWKTIQDSTFTPVETNYIAKSDTISKEIYAGAPKVSSTHAINGNKNYQIIDFILPDNTYSWSFYIACGDKGAKELEKVKSQIIKNISNIFFESNAMAALALTGVSIFNQVQGEDNVKYWFIPDDRNAVLFQNNQPFQSFKKGDVMSEASQMFIPKNGKVHLAILNDNLIEPIKVTINITAVQIINEYKTKVEQLLKVKNVEIPYLKN